MFRRLVASLFDGDEGLSMCKGGMTGFKRMCQG